jgi:carbamoyltransferase
MNYLIGISALYHDSAACIFKNNRLIYACEEEKFTGIKHDCSFPVNSLNYGLKKFKIKKEDIECVCYYENPKIKFSRIIENNKNLFLKNPFYCIKTLIDINTNIFHINKKLKNISNNIFYSDHHSSHQYYSYFTSPYNNCLILSIDGVGEKTTTAFGEFFDDQKIKINEISSYPHSLGLFYSAMTSFLGFRPNEGEYKVMGLSSYGTPDQFREKISKLIFIKDKKLICNMNIFCWNRSLKNMFTKKLSNFLEIQERTPDDTITIYHKNLAAAVQEKYEEIFFFFLNELKTSNNQNLCLSGGCAYNGLANGKIFENTNFKSIWIPPAPSDAGSCVGACLHYLSDVKRVKKITKSPFLGPKYSKKNKLKKETYKYIAKKLDEGKIIAWFQDECEFGARALGNRSILASPLIDGIKERLNKFTKKREMFRPFAPAVIKEKQSIFFEIHGDVPYMNQIVKVKDEYRKTLIATTHIDGTARIQTVYKTSKLYKLLKEFDKISGYPILLNTSFNIKDQTMVLSPKNALDTFYNTDIDILVLNEKIIEK